MSRCILIVEDDPGSKILLEKGLRSKGYEVFAASNGVEALAVLANSKVDMVISDIMMPKMDGYELCRCIKASDELAKIPFVFYTATFVGEEEERLGLELGAVDYLIKPMDLDEMVGLIESIFHHVAEEHSDSGTQSADPAVVNGDAHNDADAKALYSTVLSRKLEKKVIELEREKQKLSKSESKFRHLVEDLRKDYFLYQRGIDGSYRYVSPSVSDILGYSQQEFLSNYDQYITDHPCNREARKRFRMAVDGEEQKTYPMRFLHAKASPRELEITEHPVFDDRGVVIAVEGIAHDVTAYKELKRQYLQAQKMEALGTLVGGIAHDFNNALASMLGNLYMVKKRTAADADVQKNLQRIEDAGQRAADMIRQMLAFVRKEERQLSAVPMRPFMKEILKLARSSIPENIAIQTSLGEQDFHILGDASQMQQIMLNLLVNASHALEGRPAPVITVGMDRYQPDADFLFVHRELKNRPLLCVSVADNGCGINKANLEHVFEPFFTTKEEGKGTGLGLAMVYGSMQSHGGVIEIDSEEGAGTCIKLYFPLLATDNQVTEPKPQATVNGNNELVLLADDDQHVREVMQEILQDFGYRTLVAENGKQALSIFMDRASEIKLALLDIVMPVMGGAETAKQLRELNPDLPILFLSGYNKGFPGNEYSALHDAPVLGKPVDPMKLANSLHQYIGKTE